MVSSYRSAIERTRTPASWQPMSPRTSIVPYLRRTPFLWVGAVLLVFGLVFGSIGVAISIEDARRVREEFDPKEMLIPDRVLGLSDLVPDAVKFKYLSQPLTASQLDDLVQIPR